MLRTLTLLSLFVLFGLALGWLNAPVRTRAGNHLHYVSRYDGHLIGVALVETDARYVKTDLCWTCQRQGRR